MVKEACSVVLQRWEVMDCLRETSKDKRTLVEDLDCSRSTVNRAIRELESIGVIKYTDGEYGVTPLGESIASRFEEMMETVELWTQLEPFLQWMPEEEFDLELQHLEDAELLVPEPGNPWSMVNRHVSILSQANDIHCILPLTGLHAHEAVHEQVLQNDTRAELVVTSDVANTFQSDPAYAGLTEEMAATGRYHVFQYDDHIPYFIGLLDDTVQIGVDEQGEPRALVETDNTEVRNWAATTFEDYKQQADLVIGSLERSKIEA